MDLAKNKTRILSLFIEYITLIYVKLGEVTSR